jgi:tetratricopeptide (TPR) repeat protein
VASNRLSLFVRLAAIGMLAVNGIAWAPERGVEAIQTMVQEAEDLAHFEAFVPAMAKLETALRRAERLGDPSLTALCRDHIGSVLDFEGQAAEGAKQHQEALRLATKIGDRRLAASSLASIGLAHWRQSEYDAALGALHEALVVQEELRDDTGRARTLDFIGRVHFKRAKYTEAKESYRRAVAILDTSGDRRWLGITLEDLGNWRWSRASTRRRSTPTSRRLGRAERLGTALGRPTDFTLSGAPICVRVGTGRPSGGSNAP